MVSGEAAEVYVLNQAVHFFWLKVAGGSSLVLVLDLLTVLPELGLDRLPNKAEVISSPRSIFLLTVLLLLRGIRLNSTLSPVWTRRNVSLGSDQC